jgi:hypothetical protein
MLNKLIILEKKRYFMWISAKQREYFFEKSYYKEGFKCKMWMAENQRQVSEWFIIEKAR